jgi:hypothetical protein
MVGSRWPMLNLMCRQAYEPQLNKQNIFFGTPQGSSDFFSVFDSCFILEVCMTRKCISCVCVSLWVFFLFSWAQSIAVRGQVRVSIRTLLLTSDFPFSLQDWARDLSLFSILGPYWASRPWFSRARLSTSFQSFAEHIAFLLGHIAATS